MASSNPATDANDESQRSDLWCEDVCDHLVTFLPVSNGLLPLLLTSRVWYRRCCWNPHLTERAWIDHLTKKLPHDADMILSSNDEESSRTREEGEVVLPAPLPLDSEETEILPRRALIRQRVRRVCVASGRYGPIKVTEKKLIETHESNVSRSWGGLLTRSVQWSLRSSLAVGRWLGLPLPNVTKKQVAVFGLDNVGKTTLLFRLSRPKTNSLQEQFFTPSGHKCVEVISESVRLRLTGYDLGGQVSPRLWRTTLEAIEDSDAMIWMVDTSDPVRWEEAQREVERLLHQLKSLLTYRPGEKGRHSSLLSKPWLVLLNKVDKLCITEEEKRFISMGPEGCHARVLSVLLRCRVQRFRILSTSLAQKYPGDDVLAQLLGDFFKENRE